MKAIITFLILILLACAGNTQISNPDTVCFPVRDAQRVLKAAKDSKIFKAERDTAKKLIRIMDQRLHSKDSTIDNLSASLSANSKLIDSYKDEVSNLVDQRDKQKLDTKYYQNLYDRERRKSTAWKLGGGAGILLTLIAVIIK